MALRVKIIATDTLSGSLLRISKNVLRLGVRFAKMGVLAATAISAIAIKLQKDLDIGLREIGTLMDGLTDKQMKNMTRELERLAQISGQAMKPLIKAKYDIISAGFDSVTESALLLEKATVLATAGVSDVATAGKLLTTALNAFGKSAQDAEHFSDVLFQTVKKGTTTIGALGGTFGRILGIAASVGFGFEETSAALATLTVSLGSTELAVTALQGIFIGLLKPSEELDAIIKKTTFSSVDAMVAALGFAESLALIKKTASESNIPMKDLFGNIRGLMGILPLTSTQQEQFNEILASYSDIAGVAKRASDEIMKAFDKSVARMQRGIENILRSLGRELIKKLQPKIDAFNLAMESMGELNWQKLAQILFDNWDIILTALGKMALFGGQIIGIKLMDAIIDGIKAAFPKLAGTLDAIGNLFSFLGKKARGMSNEMAIAMMQAEKALEDVGFDASTEKIAELQDGIRNIAKDLINLFVPAFNVAAEAVEEFNEKVDEKPEDGEGSAIIKAAKITIDTAQQITDAVGNIHANFLNLRRAQIQSELDEQIGAVLASGLAEEEKQAKISNLREEARRKEIAAAKAMKPVQIAQAISNTALAVIKALASTVPPFNFVLAALVGAAGAAQVATIAAQPFARGGFVKMGGSLPASDTIPAMLSPNEIVSTAAASERFSSEISRFNQLAEGGFGSAGGDTIIIQAIDAQSFADMVRRNPNGLAEAIQITKEERFL